jgi:hypothetical protein
MAAGIILLPGTVPGSNSKAQLNEINLQNSNTVFVDNTGCNYSRGYNYIR